MLYTAVAIVATGAVGAPALAETTAPLQAAARAFPASWSVTAVSAGGVAAMLGVILSQLLGLSRMAFAMARRGDLPRSFAEVHPRHGTPVRAVVVIGAITTVVAATGTLAGVASAAAFAILVYYGIANVAALRMPVGAKLYPDAVPVVGAAVCALLAVSLSLRVIAIGVAVLASGLLARAVARRRWLR